MFTFLFQLCVFVRTNNNNGVSHQRQTLADIFKDINTDIKTYFNGSVLTQGTNPLKYAQISEIINKANIQRGEVCWEIGMGVPYLALMLARVTNTSLVGTDIGKKSKCSQALL